jgi:hypothetical protein
VQINDGAYNFSESPWDSIDNKTLAEFKALAIYDKIGKKLLPMIYPEVNFAGDKFHTQEKLIYPRKNPQQLSEVLDSIKNLAEEYFMKP